MRTHRDEFAQPAIGPLYIASYLAKYGNYRNIQVMECGKTDSNALKRVNPDIVGISSITQNFTIAKRLCAEIKQSLDVPIIIGGFHITALPQTMTPDMDIGVIGEGEQTMLDLVYAYEDHGLDKRYLNAINGITYRDENRLVATPKRELITPIDIIPYPARHLIDYDPSQVKSVITSRGCPYHCQFCSQASMWNSIRYHSPEYVIGEIRQIWQDYRPKSIGLDDDLFAVNKPRLRKMIELARQESWFGKIKFICSARANLADNETAKLLKELGVYSVFMGFETFTEKNLNYLKCNSVTVQQNKDAINTFSDAGLEIIGSFIIGSPDETKEEMLETLNTIKNSKLTYFEVNALLPLPVTKVWEEAKARGLVSDDMNWSELGFSLPENPNSRVIVSKIPREELLQVLQLFLKERSRRLRKRLFILGMKHPEKIAEYLRNQKKSKNRIYEINRNALGRTD